MNIKEYLATLGNSAGEVAATLRADGIRGMPKRSDCPVVNGIKKNCNGFARFIISPKPGVLTFRDPQIMDPKCPKPVAEFMERFDAGEFKDLAW